MVLLKIKGAYKIPISLEEIEQPGLGGFDWMQLGLDSWFESTDRGLRVVNFERTMALFPNRPGPLAIEPFTHHLTLVTKSGERFERDVRSDPVTLDVLPRPEGADWWLPVRRIEVEDRWSNAPEDLGPGEGALRVLTLDIRGVKPSLIPPMPELEAAGAMAFPHPEKRFEKLGNRGPRALIFWRWTVRPDKPPSAYLKPLHLPYFDTVAREHKEIVIASQRIAMSDEAIAEYEQETGETVETTAPVPRQEGGTLFATIAPAAALLLGLLGGLTAMVPGLRIKSREELTEAWRRLLPDPDRRALRRAARSGDPAAARAAAKRLEASAENPAAIADAIAALDRDLYGPEAASPDLRSFAKRVLQKRFVRSP